MIFFKYLRFDVKMMRSFAKKRQASLPAISISFYSEKKIKKVFDWILIKGRIFFIADTTVSLRK